MASSALDATFRFTSTNRSDSNTIHKETPGLAALCDGVRDQPVIRARLARGLQPAARGLLRHHRRARAAALGLPRLPGAQDDDSRNVRARFPLCLRCRDDHRLRRALPHSKLIQINRLVLVLFTAGYLAFGVWGLLEVKGYAVIGALTFLVGVLAN